MIYFGWIIPQAQRLSKSDYIISSYIREIGKARNFHGDKSVVDLSMGNPDLTPPEKAKDKAHELKGRVAEKLDETKENIKEGAEKIKDKAHETKGRIAEKIDEKKQEMKEKKEEEKHKA